MNNDLGFEFSMLSKKQLLKLCIHYSLKMHGSIPNNYNTEEELLKLVEDNLKVNDDGSIARKDNAESEKEVKLMGGSKIRMIII